SFGAHGYLLCMVAYEVETIGLKRLEKASRTCPDFQGVVMIGGMRGNWTEVRRIPLFDLI
ncbi:MAG: hypothetical protein K0R28_3634, partial [Paenibacillus sp.]|nr:hypothetical protein [Paenibacillus sp.]